MTLAEVLAATHDAGIVLEARGETLHVEAPRGAVTPELRTALTAHKRTLLDVVWRLDAMRRHGFDGTPDRAHPERPPVAVARWPGCGGPGSCLSCDAPLEHPEAYGRCSPCDVAADLFYAMDRRDGRDAVVIG
jgi:hypothetical protein